MKRNRRKEGRGEGGKVGKGEEEEEEVTFLLGKNFVIYKPRYLRNFNVGICQSFYERQKLSSLRFPLLEQY